jgi:hypothetical protein
VFFKVTFDIVLLLSGELLGCEGCNSTCALLTSKTRSALTDSSAVLKVQQCQVQLLLSHYPGKSASKSLQYVSALVACLGP